jgi:apolipoprotein D and lipocalin family protein
MKQGARLFRLRRVVPMLVPLLGAVAALAAERGKTPVRAVSSVDLERYSGRWYEIARLPNRFQDDCACCVTATYTRREDGKITVVNECRTVDGQTKSVQGEARLASEGGPGSKLEVRFAPRFLSFLGFVWGDYWILDLDEDYSRALVGAPDRKYLWVLSREPTMPEEAYAAFMDKAREMGFDISGVQRTPQEE